MPLVFLILGWRLSRQLVCVYGVEKERREEGRNNIGKSG